MGGSLASIAIAGADFSESTAYLVFAGGIVKGLECAGHVLVEACAVMDGAEVSHEALGILQGFLGAPRAPDGSVGEE